MSLRRRIALGIACALSMAAWPGAGAAVSRVAVGEVVRSGTVKTLDGRPGQLVSSRALANVLVFFRPGQAYSLETLQGLAGCTEEFAAKPVHFAAVVSSSWPAEQVRESLVEAGVRMPVLVDRDDELYGELGLQVYPAIVVLDAEQRLVANEPFRRVNFCDRVRGKIQYALHEIDLAGVRRTEDPHAATAASGAAAAPEVIVSARTFVIGSNRFEDPAPAARETLEQEREIAPAHALPADALAEQAAAEPEGSPR
jgi:hypothetical protein